jgi:hypothetical protein
MSEAEVHTVLKFVQFLEQGHVRPRVGDTRELMKQAKVIIDDLVEIVDIPEQPEVELVRAPLPLLLDGAVEVPEAEWGVTLDGFSHMFHDLDCHLWVQSDNGETYTIAREAPLGQIYFDDRGSERCAVQVALNRSGTTYGDFRFMHRIVEPRTLYIRDAAKDGLVDVIIESKGQFTVLETSIPDSPEPGIRKLAFLDLIKERQATGTP